MKSFTPITVQTEIRISINKVWECWTLPEHIQKWNHATDDWHTPWAKNDLRVGGIFASRMEAKDGSFGFDFSGTYTRVIPYRQLSYVLGDERKVDVLFEVKEGHVKITETFDAESVNPVELQRNGWQAILDNFKKYISGLPEGK